MADETADQKPPSPLRGLMPLLVVSCVIAAAAGGGGYMTGLMLTKPAQAQDSVDTQTPPSGATNEHFYYRLEPIMANLSDARMARYIRATPTLAIRLADKDAATAMFDSRRPEVKGWLMMYLSGCTIENVRGPDNLKRMQREIMDGLNDKLWPDQRPLIVDVILEDMAVQ